MYLTVLKAAITEALRATFNGTYPEADFRNIKIDIEYPMDQAAYPGLWIQYEDTANLVVAGIGHKEYLQDPVTHNFTEVTRWRFTGTVTVTCVALTTLEKDRLYDEVVRVFAFGRENQSVSAFRDLVEQNDLVALNINFDDLKPSGDTPSPAPWGTEDLIYEKSLSMDLIGEFVGDPSTNALVPLKNIVWKGYVDGDPVPPFPDEDPNSQFLSTDWH